MDAYDIGNRFAIDAPRPHPQTSKQVQTHRRRAPLLSPDLRKALKDLAASEGLPLATIVAVLINEGLTRRLRSRS